MLELFAPSSASRICVGSPCGFANSRARDAIVGSRLHSGCPRAALVDAVEADDPVVINVIVVGTDRCTLCAKALLSIRRIISSIVPPLAYERLPDNLPSAWALTVGARIVPSLRDTNLGLQVRSREDDALPALGSIAYRAGVPLRSAASGAKKGPPAVPSLDYNKSHPASPVQGGERGDLSGGSSQDLQAQAQLQGRVRVGLASLDSAEARETLGVCEGDVQHLREEVPIILVGGKTVSRLKFNGPAVRAALLQELKTLQGKHPKTLKNQETIP
ncbi:uncharacterized protein EMH_0056360 [Eimeria mitis]|uniref:Glutaredoxin domain-containing protein n=1 Tax=Eimeria mitis TaxID=44415 RepID=U6K7D5_9EIME|nr:uncharacterized protein EMH_0056360 [Eimeria mitis]CDJ33849.1 hypothetical protein, conserved [Eimeria mitis]